MDILWLTTDVTDNPDYHEALRRHYGQGLDKIERMLVEVNEWEFPGTPYPECLAGFRGLRCIELLWEQNTSQQQEESQQKGIQEVDQSIDKGLRAI